MQDPNREMWLERRPLRRTGLNVSPLGLAALSVAGPGGG